MPSTCQVLMRASLFNAFTTSEIEIANYILCNRKQRLKTEYPVVENTYYERQKCSSHPGPPVL